MIFSVPNARPAGTILTVPAVKVIEPVTALVVSATEVAVMLTLAFAGTVAGAAYETVVPFGVIVPQPGEHGVGGDPWTRFQVTP